MQVGDCLLQDPYGGFLVCYAGFLVGCAGSLVGYGGEDLEMGVSLLSDFYGSSPVYYDVMDLGVADQNGFLPQGRAGTQGADCMRGTQFRALPSFHLPRGYLLP